jgi:hypothetical protein
MLFIHTTNIDYYHNFSSEVIELLIPVFDAMFSGGAYCSRTLQISPLSAPLSWVALLFMTTSLRNEESRL